MFDHLTISMATWSKLWRRAILRLFLKLGSWPLIYPAIEIEIPGEGLPCSPLADDSVGEKSFTTSYKEQAKRTVYVLKSKRNEKDAIERKDVSVLSGMQEDTPPFIEQLRYASNGGSNNACLFTMQGRKGVNQDAMIVWENFTSQEDVMFCGVFDGHGRDGHRVARTVRDILPQKLAAYWKSLQQDANVMTTSSDESENESHGESDNSVDVIADPSSILAWKESFVMAYKVTDRELLIDDYIDCVSSGTTAVTLVKQGNDLIVGNVGDSRAILGTRAGDDTLLALQLTVDSKPNVPREAERIRRHSGRVFALRNEPFVHRVWLPHQNAPGLAMARALGDYCLKNHGVIAEPEVTYRRLSEKDEFVVLATDGVWDVLTNEQVVEIVASTPVKSQAARTVVEGAVHAWKSKQRPSKVDDCAVVCLFL